MGGGICPSHGLAHSKGLMPPKVQKPKVNRLDTATSKLIGTLSYKRIINYHQIVVISLLLVN
ncbi:hypothetical protein OVS_03440 [Mycoplasma ovis str. Michigan]|uniref:Uncharacterized protein n=1 Tax=Mycoplasma ovis str. Michigan TaxID=1415773 RepID=A0ABM5P1U2_9MOLU|nr:hypothetical protein OVS_03440 [Mycoplasma ovis str. Michigan]